MELDCIHAKYHLLFPLLLRAETTKAMLPALMEVVTNALMSLIPDTKAKAIAVPITDANQVLSSDLLSAIAT